MEELNIDEIKARFNIDNWVGNFVLLTNKELPKDYKLTLQDLIKVFYVYKVKNISENGFIQISCKTIYLELKYGSFRYESLNLIKKYKDVKFYLSTYKFAYIIDVEQINEGIKKYEDDLIHKAKCGFKETNIKLMGAFDRIDSKATFLVRLDNKGLIDNYIYAHEIILSCNKIIQGNKGYTFYINYVRPTYDLEDKYRIFYFWGIDFSKLMSEYLYHDIAKILKDNPYFRIVSKRTFFNIIVKKNKEILEESIENFKKSNKIFLEDINKSFNKKWKLKNK